MLQVTFLNLTEQEITCSWESKSRSASYEESLLSPPSLSTTTTISRQACRHLSFTSRNKQAEVEDVKAVGPVTEISLSLSSSWQVIKLPEDSLWRMYSTKVEKNHYRIAIFPRRDTAAFLSDIHDNVPLSSILLPGTHDTMAFYGWPISQCQTLETPLKIQLESGIRVIDVRLSLIKGALISYHGVYPQKTPFTAILATLYVFLSNPVSSRETVVMSIKQEDYNNTSQQDFSRAVHDEIANSPGGLELFYLEDRIPRLGEVRGKVVMFSRFNGWDAWEGGKLGIHPTTWPDSERKGFSWDCKGTHVRTHDWYAIPSFLFIPEKVKLSTEILLPPSDPRPTLSIAFFSASSFPFASPPTIAQGFGWPKLGLGVEGVNSRVGKWLLDTLSNCVTGNSSLDKRVHSRSSDESEKTHIQEEEPRVRGWALMDYYNNPEHALVPLLVECNFRGRKVGEEGW
ncbi:PLC-like phosphodiesterase [Marasmius fiardii PR-910]|nr:PLC-like phosphodiesterase [Marasmius fiardii PR-910]